MKIVFVYWGYENAGSMLDLRGYTRAAKAMGHEIVVYGPSGWAAALDYSKDLSGADALVFVVEWTTALQFGDSVDWLRLLDAVPRERRIVIDCDGHYNEPIWFGGDYNHRTMQQSAEWIAFCDSLSDKIFQPSYRPRRSNVRPFLFHIYDPAWEAPIVTDRGPCEWTTTSAQIRPGTTTVVQLANARCPGPVTMLRWELPIVETASPTFELLVKAYVFDDHVTSLRKG
ncbi:MAG: hypothetical protein ABL886_16875, partial [Rhodoglobus sp.]